MYYINSSSINKILDGAQQSMKGSFYDLAKSTEDKKYTMRVKRVDI